MTGIELVGLLSSSANIGKILSKFFMPPEAIQPDVKMTYFAEESQLEYRASFKIPKQGIFKKFKKIAGVKLKCPEGFLVLQARLETEKDLREFIIPVIHCSLPPLIGLEEKPISEARVLLRVVINIDLSHCILKEWFPFTPSDNHLKARITNTMDILVRNYQLRERMPINRRLKKAIVVQDGNPKEVPLLLHHQSELYCTQGDLEREFPNLDTSSASCFDTSNMDMPFERSSEIIVPIENLPENRDLIVDLVFD